MNRSGRFKETATKQDKEVVKECNKYYLYSIKYKSRILITKKAATARISDLSMEVIYESEYTTVWS